MMEKKRKRGACQSRPLKLIESSKGQKATFLKRRDGIMKKAMELQTLCDLPTLVICSGADTTDIKTWPEDQNEVLGLVARYAGINQYERNRWRKDTETLMKAQIGKTRSQIQRMQEEKFRSFPDVGRKNYSFVDSLPEVGDFGRFLDAKIEEINQRISYLSNNILTCHDNSPLLDLKNFENDLKNCDQNYLLLDLKNCENDLKNCDQNSPLDFQNRSLAGDDTFAGYDHQQQMIMSLSNNDMFKDDDIFTGYDHHPHLNQQLGFFNDNNTLFPDGDMFSGYDQQQQQQQQMGFCDNNIQMSDDDIFACNFDYQQQNDMFDDDIFAYNFDYQQQNDMFGDEIFACNNDYQQQNDMFDDGALVCFDNQQQMGVFNNSINMFAADDDDLHKDTTFGVDFFIASNLSF